MRVQAIKTTRIAGGLLFGYNPGGAGLRLKAPGPDVRPGRMRLMPGSRPRRQAGGYLANGSSYSLTLNLSRAWSAASCSRMYFAIVASFSPTVDT